jgi:predicted secreted protein
MAKNGSLVAIIIGTKLIAGETTSSISLIRDMIETTHKHTSESAKTYISGEKGGTISVTGCIDPDNSTDYGYSDAYAAYNLGTAVTFKAGSITVGEKHLTGSALISNLTWDGPQNDRSTFTIELQITGPTEEATTTS